ncbi:hypothetical protein MKX01_019923, partial [Papaver californicum]
MGMSDVISLSSKDDAPDHPSRRWSPTRALPRIDSTGINDVRGRFDIPDSVEIFTHHHLFDPAGDDEVVPSLYQLECGLPMPIDQETCEILADWGIALPQTGFRGATETGKVRALDFAIGGMATNSIYPENYLQPLQFLVGGQVLRNATLKATRE